MKFFRRRSILASIGTVGLLTGVAYTASIIRDAILAAFYGGSEALDIYFLALAPSQFLGLEIASLVYLAFLPEFSRSLKDGDDPSVTHLLERRVALTLKGGVGVAVLLAAGALAFLSLLAPGHVRLGLHRVTWLSFASLSALIPILGVIGVLRAFLEARGRFVPWAVLPAFRSGVLTIVVLLTAASPSITWLIAGSLLGAGAGLAYSWSTTRRLLSSLSVGSRDGKTIGPRLPGSLAPLVAALGVGQATVLLDNSFASQTGLGGVQAFALASNLLVIPQALITGAVATVYFPVYGAHFSRGHHADAVTSLRRSIRIVMWSAIPVVLLFCTDLGTILTRMIYHRGAFDYRMVMLVSQTAGALSLGLAPYACTMLMRQYALAGGGPWLAFHATAIFFVAKWLGNLAFTDSIGVPGIALSSSIAATVACVYLAVRVLPSARRWTGLT